MYNVQRIAQFWQTVRLVSTVAFFTLFVHASPSATEMPRVRNQAQTAPLNAVVNLASTASVGSKRSDSLWPNGVIAVLYPNTREPFRSVFMEMIKGIEEQTKRTVLALPIENERIEPAELNEQIRRNDIKAVIALGNVGMKAAASIEQDVPLVVGGIFSTTDQDQKSLTGISLTPDPAVLFSKLKTLLPETKKVIVVYNPQSNESLIKLARQAAKMQGISLQVFEARTLAEAGRAYEMIFKNPDKQNTALWLPNDRISVEENTILPLILKEAWNTSLPFFSSSLGHVKMGALFGCSPNNTELGRNLGISAMSMMAGENRKKGVSLLREVFIGVNLRTASHLGLEVDRRSFDISYPEL